MTVKCDRIEARRLPTSWSANLMLPRKTERATKVGECTGVERFKRRNIINATIKRNRWVPGIGLKMQPPSDIVPATPNCAQPPLPEATACSHGSPVFHLTTINERGNVISAETGVHSSKPRFFRHGIVELLVLGDMLRRAHRLHLGTGCRVGVHGIEHWLLSSEPGVWSRSVILRWRLHTVGWIMRGPGVGGVGGVMVMVC
jgi:hypothetical protein